MDEEDRELSRRARQQVEHSLRRDRIVAFLKTASEPYMQASEIGRAVGFGPQLVASTARKYFNTFEVVIERATKPSGSIVTFIGLHRTLRNHAASSC